MRSDFDNGDISCATGFGRDDYQVRMPILLDLGIAVTVDNLAISTSLRYKDWGSTKFNLFAKICLLGHENRNGMNNIRRNINFLRNMLCMIMTCL